MMPRYYRDKIYSEEEKELLWLQKLDKGDTWVMGEKCKIDSEEYKNLLNYYREQARQIHGDNITLWKEKQYFERGDWEFNKYNGKNTREYYVFKNGTRAMMQRYYRDKIYSEEEKELLWL